VISSEHDPIRRLHRLRRVEKFTGWVVLCGSTLRIGFPSLSLKV
jgi:hypothetical protein